MNEKWRDIKGYEKLYQVSDLGRVRSMPRLVHVSDGYLRPISGKIMKQGNIKGYRGVTLCKDGTRLSCSVHRLVAETFISNPLNKPEVNHINENKADNRVENLEWATSKENANHGTRNERASKATSRVTIQYDIKGRPLMVFKSAREAMRHTGIHNTDISACARGLRSTAGGFIWRYDSMETGSYEQIEVQE
jgi:hypothetical protein